jgi:hypothetical protein
MENMTFDKKLMKIINRREPLFGGEAAAGLDSKALLPLSCRSIFVGKLLDSIFSLFFSGNLNGK